MRREQHKVERVLPRSRKRKNKAKEVPKFVDINARRPPNSNEDLRIEFVCVH